MNRVLVTGASGFIGRHVVRALAGRGFEIHGTGRHGAPGDLGLAAWHTADLLTERGREQVLTGAAPTHVVHLAWETKPGFYRDSPDNALWAIATQDLLHRALARGVQRIVGIGSCFEYGGFNEPCKENASGSRPSTPYGQSKRLAAEAFTAAAQAGANTAWGRVFFPFGPSEASGRLIPALLQSLSAGRTFDCSHGAQIREFMFVEDLAQAIVALLESRVAGIVNLAAGEPRSLRDLITAFAERLDALALVNFGVRDVSGIDAEPSITANISRLRDEIGWRPPIGFDAGVDKTLAWWRSRASE